MRLSNRLGGGDLVKPMRYDAEGGIRSIRMQINHATSQPCKTNGEHSRPAHDREQGAWSDAPHIARRGTGTFGKLVLDFYRSVEFANLKPSSDVPIALCSMP